jgi:hypothetical protein
MTHKLGHVIDDFSPRTRELAKSTKRVAWGRNSLDCDRQPFSAEEIAIARRIGTPADKRDDDVPTK